MSESRPGIERIIKESYNNVKPYLNNEKNCSELHKMCENCGRWCGKDHDYSECENMNCFRFYLAYNYLCWSSSYEE